MIRWMKSIGAVAVVFAMSYASFVNAEETKGTIKSVDSGKNEIVLKGLVQNSLYEINKDAPVCLDGVKSKLADLTEGDQVAIVYAKQGEHLIASEVRGLRHAKETSGTVRDVFTDKKEITLKGIVKDSTYELDKTATVWVNGDHASLSDIKAGDEVKITYQEKGDHYMAARVCALRK